MKTYIVTHHCPNPRNNTAFTLNRKRDALEELRKMDGQGTSRLVVDGRVIAFRDWNKSRITWM